MHEPNEEHVPLSQAATYLLEECRMVLPGIQALFGFQLIAVFNPSFAEKLSGAEQGLHILAIALLAIAIALIMAPAAFHRQSGPDSVTSDFIRLASRLLLASMGPLAFSIAADFYLVARIVTDDSRSSALFAVALFFVFVSLWFVLPHMRKRRQSGNGTSRAGRR